MAIPNENCSVLPLSDYEAVCKLRERVKDILSNYYDTDFNLLRWLQGHNYEIETVVPKLRDHLLFRKTSWNLDELSAERNSPMQSYWEWGLSGMSGKDNCLVYIEQTGREDIDGLMNTVSVLQLIRARMLDYERMHREIMNVEARTGKQSGMSTILDLDGLRFGPALLRQVRGPFKTIVNIQSDNYVELSSHIIIVNAPKFIYRIWSIVYPFLPERTREKVRILSSNWRQEIKDFIDPSVLPSHWNKSENDEFKFNLPLLTKVPTSMYSKNTKLGPAAKTVFISAGNFELIDIKIENPQKILKFGFQAYGEVGFGIFYAENSEEKDTDKMEMVYPRFRRLQGPFPIPAYDQFMCKKAGCYKLWLSNKHAWWSSLKVEYLIKFNDESIFC